jgi:peptide/nickel transport system substrate-binding protein
VIAVLSLVALGGGWAAAQPHHGIAMHGEPAMPEDFKAFRYVNPDAPKGGRFVEGVVGTFDSLNPFIVKGVAAPALRGPLILPNAISFTVVESLMVRGFDEPFTLYGLLAQTVETDAARSYVTFTLNPAARFSDGTPVTATDLLFSWQLLRDKGRPNYRYYYAKVAKAETISDRAVRFDLTGSEDRELPLILGLMPVFAKHATNPDTFEETSFSAPLGSGPYLVSAVDPGRSLTLRRNPDYWGRDLAVNRGFWNFDELRFDYYREANSYHEAFQRGLFDFRTEGDPGHWQTGYDFPALRDGRVIKEALPSGLPKASFFYAFNTRRPVFADIRVRQAVALLFDFEWINRNLYFGQFGRSASFFEGSELSALKRAADARERALLAPFPGAVRPDVLEGTWAPPVTDGSGRDRGLLRQALNLFAEAGYELRGTELVDKRTGAPFSFEIMVTLREDERLAIAFATMLKRAGINARVRMVDAVQFEGRRLNYDYDMIENRWDQSLSPGNEQAFYFGSAAADEPGTRNYMGVKSPAVDAMIAALLKAESREDFVAAVRVLDRLLISGSYVIPLFHVPAQWIARWRGIERPAQTAVIGYLPETWWRGPK